ncbi:MAG: acyltransferase [Nitrospina sp.]|jgi:galactoside O-acetyltransferase|nr:acyltransferase [Nitrospina sp.]
MIMKFEKFVRELKVIFSQVIMFFPGKLGNLFRQWWLKSQVQSSGSAISVGMGLEITGGKNIRLGDRVNIMRFNYFYAIDGRIELGSDVSINSNVQIGAADGGKIIIGDHVIIGPNVVLRASNHAYERVDIPIKDQGHTGGEIIIENDVWICANVVVTKDVRIGAHSIIAAGSVVTSDVEPYSVFAGVPAKLLRKRN